MKAEIKYAIYMMGLGVSLVTYAQFNFATSPRVEKIEAKIESVATRDDMRELRQEFDSLRKEIIEIYKRGK
jgi:polyhydroxyalkanoate synthesis regulator phasin